MRQHRLTSVSLATVLVALAFNGVNHAADPGDLLREATARYGERKYAEAIALATQAIELRPDDAGAYQTRGEANFCAGKIKASIADFDRFLKIHPDREPHHWQRGISYYYAGEYRKGVRQFEVHQRVNSQDVENAIWHYLCKSRVDGVDKARGALIEIRTDRRPWAMPVYRMFRGERTPEQVLADAAEVSRSEADRQYNMFYAHLYVGLFCEAAGRADDSRKQIQIAVDKYPSVHYMGDVARVHLQLRPADVNVGSKAATGGDEP